MDDSIASESRSTLSVDVMDEYFLFYINQLAKEKAHNPAGKTPTLILTDPTGKRRLGFANFRHLQEIRAFQDLEESQESKDESGGQGDWKATTDEKYGNDFHGLMYRFTESYAFRLFMMLVILIDCALLIAMSFDDVFIRRDWYIIATTRILLALFTVEVALHLYVWRGMFFWNGCFVLDFVLVILGLIEFLTPLVLEVSNIRRASSIVTVFIVLRALRALRALRILRLINFVPSLRILTRTILRSMKSITAILSLMLLFLYMFAVIGRSLYGDTVPMHFGTLWESVFTCFILLTLDDWFDIYDNVTKADPAKEHIIVFLVVYIVLEYLIFFNLFVAVLVDNFQVSTWQTTTDQQKAIQTTESELAPAIPEDNVSKLSEDMIQRKTMRELYPSMDPEDLEQLERHLQLMCAIEYHSHDHQVYQKLLDGMVDNSVWQLRQSS